MSTSILIIGESGTGKSTSIRTLDPRETFIINIDHKPLPFKGWQKSYKSEGKEMTYFVPQLWDNEKKHQCTALSILHILSRISDARPEIKTVIIDDAQYMMSNEFMHRATERGYDRFSEIGQHANFLLEKMNFYRNDLILIFMWHSQINEDGISRPKTIGKLLSEKVTMEGKFVIVFQSSIRDGKYQFQTNGDETTIAKSPLGMFEEKYIENDLQIVVDTVNRYNEIGKYATVDSKDSKDEVINNSANNDEIKTVNNVI